MITPLESDYSSFHKTVTKAATNKSPKRLRFFLTGRVRLDVKGGDGVFKHETVRLQLQPSLFEALEQAISENGIVRPPNGRARLRVSQWAMSFGLCSMFNDGASIKSGFDLKKWDHSPFDIITSTPGNLQLNHIFTGVDVDVGASDKDAVLKAISYVVELIGEVVFKYDPGES